MIYLFQELDLISNELLHQMIFSLPVARREYVQHFKLPEDQKRSALALSLIHICYSFIRYSSRGWSYIFFL